MTINFHSVALMGRTNTKGVVKTLRALVSYLQQRKLEIVLES